MEKEKNDCKEEERNRRDPVFYSLKLNDESHDKMVKSSSNKASFVKNCKTLL